MKRTCTFLSLFYLSLAALIPLIVPGQAISANYPLEIIQPQPNLTTVNRFYKAYPGLEYSVNVSVIGGTFPFSYALTTAPSGMTIDENTGLITWGSPTTSGSPHTVTAQVTDSEGTIKTVTWTVTVTTSGFRFIDASANPGGDGSINSPWDSLSDAFESSKYDRSYQGEFLYFRSGTYITSNLPREDSDRRVPMVANYKPQVWLAYPGDPRPVIDMGGAYLIVYAGGTNVYFDGLMLRVNNNVRTMGITIGSDTNNVVMHNIIFEGDNFNGTIGGNNALLFMSYEGSSGKYWAIINSTFKNINEGYGILGYSAAKVLIANNTFTNLIGHSAGPKEGTNMWFIRANTFIGNGGYYGVDVQYSDTHGVLSGNMEITHNYIEANGNPGITINSNWTNTGDPVYIYRNTLKGTIRLIEAQSTNGPFYVHHNVIIDDTDTFFAKEGTVDATRLVIADNLTGNTTNNIIDSNGYLTDAYASSVGVYGFQTDGSATVQQPPAAPVDFTKE